MGRIRVATFISIGLFVFGCSHEPSKDETLKEGAPGSSASSADASTSPDDSSAPSTAQAQKSLSEDQLKKYKQDVSHAIADNRYDAAETAAQHALAINSKDKDALNAMGLVYLQRKRYRGALYFFERALKSQPDSGDFLSNLGLTYLLMGERKEAIVYLKKAIAVDPGNPTAALNLGSIYNIEHDYKHAISLVEVSMRKYSSDYGAVNNYGTALAGNGDYDGAKKQFMKAIQLAPTRPEAVFNVAQVDIQFLKLYPEGLEYLEKLKLCEGNEAFTKQMSRLQAEAAKAGNK